MRYRSRMDIVADMLRVAQDGAIKTRIMYRAFLSYPQLKEYLGLMTDGGLLEYSKDDGKYYTTEKGRHFLKMYREIGRAITPKGSNTARTMVLEAS
jgi:predicted transcriptional regulator